MTYRPRIKLAHRPVRIGENRIRIGGDVYGLNADILDPDGWCWALLALLDGTRTVDQVIVSLVHRFPGRSADDVRTDIGDLARAGYVEDASEAASDELSEREWARYGPSMAYWQWADLTPDRPTWQVQVLLRRARVLVVGMGGVGCSAALALVQSGVGHVHCVDPDVVALSNLNRQSLFTEPDVGRSKVGAAVARLRAHNSDIEITGQQLSVDGPATLQTLAVGFDVVMLAADQPRQILSWTNRACLATRTAWVHGGYHGPEVGIGLYRPGTGPCYDCGRVEEEAGRTLLPSRTQWPPAVGIDPPHAVSAVTAGITGLLAAHAAMSLITGAPALPVNRQYRYNLATLLDAVVLGPEAPSTRCLSCGP